MRCDVLIIDDRAEERSDDYTAFAAQVANTDDTFEIKIHNPATPAEVISTLNGNKIDLAIIDAVLDEEWEDFTLRDALDEIGDIPFLLVSSQWDNANAKLMGIGSQQKNFQGFLHWRDINGIHEDNVAGDDRYAVISFQKAIYQAKKSSSGIKIGRNDPIHILQLSDLQFGGIRYDNMDAHTENLAHEVKTTWQTTPHFIAVTGDIAERAMPDEYDLATRWINKFLKHLDPNNSWNDRVLFVPGNHDVNVPFSAASRLTYDRDTETIVLQEDNEWQYLRNFANRPYLDFRNQFSTCPHIENIPGSGENNHHAEAYPWVESRFKHLGLIFYGINTAMPSDAAGLPQQSVCEHALTKIRNRVKELVDNAPEDQQPVIIGLGHHNPTTSSEDTPKLNSERFEAHFKNPIKTHIFLHGHYHRREIKVEDGEGFRLLRCGAQTLTKGPSGRPIDTLRGLNLISLNRDSGVVTGAEVMSLSIEQGNLIKTFDREYRRLSDGMFQTNH